MGRFLIQAPVGTQLGLETEPEFENTGYRWAKIDIKTL